MFFFFFSDFSNVFPRPDTFKNFEVVGEGKVVKTKPKPRATLGSVFPGAVAAGGGAAAVSPVKSGGGSALVEPHSPGSIEFPGL